MRSGRSSSCIAIALSLAGCAAAWRRRLWLSAVIRWSGSRKRRGRRRQRWRSPRRANGIASRTLFFDDIRWVEDWTLNGPYLDGISFVTGLQGRQDAGPPAPPRRPPGAQVPVRHDRARNRGDDRKPVPGPRRRGRFQDDLARSRGRSSAPTASSSISSISTATKSGAAAGRSARWSTASFT